MELQVLDEEGMVGSGDFRGFHFDNPDSKYRALISRIKKGHVSDPTMQGKLLNQPGGKWMRFCCDTGCSTNLMPAKMAAMSGLRWSPLDPDEPQYRSVTNEKLEIVGQTSCFVKLEKVKTPVKLSFLVCLDDGSEALLSLDTLKDLSIVSKDFPCPMDDRIKDHKTRRIITDEEENEWPEQKQKENGNKKQSKREIQKYTLQERVDSLRSQLNSKQVNKKEWEEERKCEEIKKAWLRDYPEVFKEDLSKEDRIDMDPVVVDLIPDHEQVEVFHPKASNEVPAYLKTAAEKS